LAFRSRISKCNPHSPVPIPHLYFYIIIITKNYSLADAQPIGEQGLEEVAVIELHFPAVPPSIFLLGLEHQVCHLTLELKYKWEILKGYKIYYRITHPSLVAASPAFAPIAVVVQ